MHSQWPKTSRPKIVWVQVGRDSLISIQVAAAASRPPAVPLQVEPSHTAQPEAAFRRNLHRALEDSHRQQMAQRALGTHAPIDWREIERSQEAQSRAWSSALLLMALSATWLTVRRWFS